MPERDATHPQEAQAVPSRIRTNNGLGAAISQVAEVGGELPRAPRLEGGILHGQTANQILKAQDLLAEFGRVQRELRLESKGAVQAFLELAHAQDEGVVGLRLFDEEDEDGRTRIGSEFIRLEDGLETPVDAAAVGLGAHAGELDLLGSFFAEDIHTAMLDATFRVTESGEISYTQKWPKQG